VNSSNVIENNGPWWHENVHAALNLLYRAVTTLPVKHVGGVPAREALEEIGLEVKQAYGILAELLEDEDEDTLREHEERDAHSVCPAARMCMEEVAARHGAATIFYHTDDEPTTIRDLVDAYQAMIQWLVEGGRLTGAIEARDPELAVRIAEDLVESAKERGLEVVLRTDASYSGVLFDFLTVEA